MKRGPRRARPNPRAGEEDTTPLEGDAFAQFEQMHWGNSWEYAEEVDLPALKVRQAVASLGQLRLLVLEDPVTGKREELRPRAPYPLVLVGAKDNRLYLGGGCTAWMAAHREWGPPYSRRTVLQIEYDAVKGSTAARFWHPHEGNVLPTLQILGNGFPAYVGGNYVIHQEGIVG